MLHFKTRQDSGETQQRRQSRQDSGEDQQRQHSLLSTAPQTADGVQVNYV